MSCQNYKCYQGQTKHCAGCTPAQRERCKTETKGTPFVVVLHPHVFDVVSANKKTREVSPCR